VLRESSSTHLLQQAALHVSLGNFKIKLVKLHASHVQLGHSSTLWDRQVAPHVLLGCIKIRLAKLDARHVLWEHTQAQPAQQLVHNAPQAPSRI